jgi:hypothetical protein
MSLSVTETGGAGKKDDEVAGRGEEWSRYWRGYARVRGKLVGLVGEGDVTLKP